MLGNVITAIPALLRGRSPSAIIWDIWTVVIFPIKGMSIAWLASHVSKEHRKRILTAPSFADGDSTPTPFCVSLAFGVEASIPHAGPRSVFRRGFISYVIPMAKMSLAALKPSDMIGIRFSFVNSSGHGL